MKKQIVLLGAVFLGVAYLFGMEECPEPMNEEFVTIITSDNKKFNFSIELARKSETINFMIDYQPNEEVVLNLISSQLFQDIKSVLESSNPQGVLKKLTLQQLVEFIQGINFLIIPDLIDISIQELAERTLSQNDVNMLFEQLDLELIKKLWSVHPAYVWLLKSWWNSSKKIKSNLVVSSDGKYGVVGSRLKGEIQIFDMDNDFKPVELILQHKNISDLLFSPKGRYLASISDGFIRIWDVYNNFKQVKNFEHRDSSSSHVLFSPDERYLVSAGNNFVNIWDLNNDFEHIVNLDSINLESILFSPDGKFLVSNSFLQGIVMVWDVRNNFEPISDGLLHDEVDYIAFSPDSRYLITFADENGISKIWDINNNFEQIDNDLLQNIEIEFGGSAFSPDGTYLALSLENDGIIKILDMNNNFEQVGNDLLHDEVERVVFSPDGKYLVSASDKIVKLWSLKDNFEQIGFDLQYDEVDYVLFSSDMKYMVLTSEDPNQVIFFDPISDFQVIGKFFRHDDINSITFSPNQTYFISSSAYQGTTHIWNMNVFQQIRNLTFDEIKLFLIAYFNIEKDKPVQVTDELRGMFNSLSPDLQALLPEQLIGKFEVVTE